MAFCFSVVQCGSFLLFIISSVISVLEHSHSYCIGHQLRDIRVLDFLSGHLAIAASTLVTAHVSCYSTQSSRMQPPGLGSQWLGGTSPAAIMVAANSLGTKGQSFSPFRN